MNIQSVSLSVQSQLSLGCLPGGKGTTVWLVLNADSIWHQSAIGSHRLVLLPFPLREAPLATDVNLLTTGELELGSPESLDNLILVYILGADRQDDLSNVNACHGSQRLAIGPTHSSLEPIGPSAGQHLVDADDMEGVQANSHVESILAGELDQVLVGTDTAGL